MESHEWLRFGRQNRIVLVLDGKEVPLRYTVHQSDCYRDLIFAQKKRFEAEKASRLADQGQAQASGSTAHTDGEVLMADRLAQRVTSLRLDSLDVVEIALNPDPQTHAYPRAEIETLLDLDQIAILAQVWVDRKVFNPRLNAPQDPPVDPQA